VELHDERHGLMRLGSVSDKRDSDDWLEVDADERHVDGCVGMLSVILLGLRIG